MPEPANFLTAQATTRRRLASASLRSRLVAAVIALDVLAALVMGTVIVLTGRSATMVEIEASMRLADGLVNETTRMMQDAPEPLILQALRMQFASIRHVRIAVLDVQGTSLPATERSSTADDVPGWFAALIAPRPQVHSVPLLVHNRKIGNVRIAAEPADEIGEAWQYAGAIFITGFVLNVVVLGLLFVVFGRVLRPLSALAGGLADLESRNYAVRLRAPSLPELAVIAAHFNRAASAVAREQTANRTLNRKLVTAQDDERRRTALDLHDEVGPCLFALDACTSSMTAPSSLADREQLARSAEEATVLVRELKAINRRVLARLRPPSLGRIPLTDCLERLVEDLAAPCPSRVDHDIGPLAKSYGAAIDLTLYRCLQEGLCNAVRHADARRIAIVVREEAGANEGRGLMLSVVDDGHGIVPQARFGLGLAGMRERVEALAGRFDLTHSPRGTALRIALPIETGDDFVATPGTSAGPAIQAAALIP